LKSATANVRVRAVLAVGLLAIVAVFVLEMSRVSPRTAGSNRVATTVFAAVVPGGGVLCQPVPAPPTDTGGVTLLVGTYGRPRPPLGLTFTAPSGSIVAEGHLPGGGPQGTIGIPLRKVRTARTTVTACLRVGGSSKVALAGEVGPTGRERVNGRRQPGDVSLLYTRRGSASWWQLLPTIDTRFGLGKVSFFGDWTLPVVVLLVFGTWVAVVRLLLRELP
jgi:hypothetical protein